MLVAWLADLRAQACCCGSRRHSRSRSPRASRGPAARARRSRSRCGAARAASAGGGARPADRPTGGVAPTGAFVVEQRDVDVPASGELRIAGVATTLDPASVQLHAADATGLAISEQRYVPGATTPTEILHATSARRSREVPPPRKARSAACCARSIATLVVEVGAGDQRQTPDIMRRDSFAQDVRFASVGPRRRRSRGA